MRSAIVPAAGSTAVFVLALGLAGVAAAAIGDDDPGLMRAVAAATTTAIVLPLLLVLLRGRRDVLAARRPAAAILGAVIVLAAGAAVYGADGLLGGTRIVAVDPRALVTFLVTNTVLALLLEALPEELTFRGAAFGALSEAMPAVTAAAVSAALFVVAPAGSILVTWAVGGLLGLPVAAPSFAPGGQDPVVYGAVLAVFAVVLTLARAATGSIWTCVGAHLAFLTVNRTLQPASGFDTGVTVRSPDGAELLVAAHLVLLVAVFAVLAARARRRGAPAD